MMSELYSRPCMYFMVISVLLLLDGCTVQDSCISEIIHASMECYPIPVEDGLVLEKASSSHVSGLFRRGAIGLWFDAGRNAERGWVTVTAIDGRQILYTTGVIQKDGPTAAATPGHMDDPHQSSFDASSFKELLELPESRLLPPLSHEMGSRGVHGDTHPASYPLHAFALAVAHALDLDAKGRSLTFSSSTSQDEESAGKSVQALSTCHAFPEGNKCDGMCGPNCGCWSHVCGDCCWHQGCQIHDLTGFYCETYGTCCDAYLTFTSYLWTSSPCSQESIDLNFVHQRCKSGQGYGGGGGRSY